MVAREANELPEASAGTPLGNFGLILEFWVQNIGQAAKNLGAMEVFAVQVSATKNSIGANPLL